MESDELKFLRDILKDIENGDYESTGVWEARLKLLKRIQEIEMRDYNI